MSTLNILKMDEKLKRELYGRVHCPEVGMAFFKLSLPEEADEDEMLTKVAEYDYVEAVIMDCGDEKMIGFFLDNNPDVFLIFSKDMVAGTYRYNEETGEMVEAEKGCCNG